MSTYDDDLSLARVLLGGFIGHDKRGKPRREYLKDENEERKPREAIARVLRSERPLERQLRNMLADLFESTPSHPFGSERLLIFKYRSKARRRDHVRNTAIAQYVHDHREVVRGKATYNKAIKSAAEEFGTSYENVKGIWGSFRWARKLGQFDKPDG